MITKSVLALRPRRSSVRVQQAIPSRGDWRGDGDVSRAGNDRRREIRTVGRLRLRSPPDDRSARREEGPRVRARSCYIDFKNDINSQKSN